MIVLDVTKIAGRSADKCDADDVRRDDAVPLDQGALGVVLGAQQGGVGDDDADLEAGTGSPRPRGLCGSVLCRVVLCGRSEEHTSELQSRFDLVCRLLLEKKKKYYKQN